MASMFSSSVTKTEPEDKEERLKILKRELAKSKNKRSRYVGVGKLDIGAMIDRETELEKEIEKLEYGSFIVLKGISWLLCLIISMFSGIVLFGCFLYHGLFIPAIFVVVLWILIYNVDDNDFWGYMPVVLAILQPMGICFLCGSGGLLGIPLLMGGMFMTLIEALPVIAAIAAAMMFFGL